MFARLRFLMRAKVPYFVRTAFMPPAPGQCHHSWFFGATCPRDAAPVEPDRIPRLTRSGELACRWHGRLPLRYFVPAVMLAATAVYDVPVAIRGKWWYWPMAAVSVVGAAIWASAARNARDNERMRREHWRAARNRGNPGSGVGAGYAFFPATVTRAVAATGVSAGEGPRLDLPTRQGDVPITAYKRARLQNLEGVRVLEFGRAEPQMIGEDRWRFAGVGMGISYDPVDVARCPHVVDERIPHDPPVVECQCGFYALAPRYFAVEMFGGPDELLKEDDGIVEIAFDVPAASGFVLLEVELYGRVIVHERGYRAEKQRVIAARACDPELERGLAAMSVEIDRRPIRVPMRPSA